MPESVFEGQIVGDSYLGSGTAWWRAHLAQKNTFLEFEFGSDQEEFGLAGSALVRSKSAPACGIAVPGSPQAIISIHSPRGVKRDDTVTTTLALAGDSGPNSFKRDDSMSLASAWTTASGSSGHRRVDSMSTESVSTGVSISSPTSKGPSANGATSLAAHEEGTCKPCVFHSRARGCDDGDQCSFCHFPHERGAEPRSRGGRKWRPCKGKRDRYHKLMERLEEAVRADPDNFSLDDVKLPALVTSRPFMLRKVSMVAGELVRAARAGLPTSTTLRADFFDDEE